MKYFSKEGAVTWYDKRPEFLVYHIHSLHILDMKVRNKTQYNFDKYRLIFQNYQCDQISFGDVDEILKSKHPIICLPVESLAEKTMSTGDEMKVIIFET